LIEEDVAALHNSLELHPRGAARIVPIRVPQYFDEFGQSAANPEEEDYGEAEGEDAPEPMEPPSADDSVRTDPGLVQMSQMVEELLVQLHSPDSPWEICDDQQCLRWTVDPTVTLSTREWILGLAEHEPEPEKDPKKKDDTFTLRQLLYLYPGALDHMANCLHMLDSLPPLPQEKEDDEDDDDEESAEVSPAAKQDAVL
jgi:hypothetical protein